MTSVAERLPRSAVLGYALGSLGAGVYSTVPTVLLLFYCTEILRITPAVAATIVFVPKAWAILWDPLVGTWSDRSRSKLGRRAPFILCGASGVAVSFALLFSVPEAAGDATVVYVMLVYFAMASAYSLFAVPYVAIPAEITSDSAERERLMVWRMTFAMLGVLLGAGVAPYLVAFAGGGRRGYGVMALVIAAVCGCAMLVTFLTVRLHHVSDRAAPRLGFDLRDGLRRILADRDYVRLWLAYLLVMSGASLFTAMVPYYVTHVLGRDAGDAGAALLALLIGTIATMPLWSKAMQRWGGWRALMVAVVAYALVAAVFVALPHGLALQRAVPLFLLLGVPFAGIQLLPFTLVAHIAHAGAARGARQEGLYTGIWTAGEKLALAIGPAAAGIGLAMSGYVSGAAAQTAGARDGLQFVMALGPTAFLLPCMFILARRGASGLARSPT